MRDLKHRVFFERLLSDVKNELVEEALAEEQLALGYSCYYVPEVLMNLDGCFSVRLRAPGITDTSIATYYMSEKTCMYSRSILERAIEGGFNFFAALLSTETCGMMHRAHEHFEMLDLVKEQNEHFFVSHIDSPFVTKDYALKHYERQLQKHVLDKLAATYGIDVSEEALRKAIGKHNELCRVVTAIGDLRPDYVNFDLYDDDEWRHVEWPMQTEDHYEGVCSGWGEVYDFHLQLDSLYSHPEVLTMSEPLLQPLGGMDSNFGYDNDYYQYFYIFSDEKIQGQTYTLHLNLNRWHDSDITFHFRPVHYQVELYHLTPEFYRYVRSINDVDNNELAEGGFAMIQPTFSNVCGGIGVVGGYGYSESGWKTIDDNK